MNTTRKILIVDDEPDILEFLSYNFRKKGYEVVTANDGAEGVKKTRSERPHLIISDILMPEMDGIEMCREIRSDLLMKNIPFIFLTAVNDDYKILYAMTSGADQFVSKPTRFDYLFRMVESMVIKRDIDLSHFTI
ncbi:MAG: PleD family two-component system response regulator [Bacteroidia bacterium]